jgi:DNA repair protein RecN (Recombination protein N)
VSELRKAAARTLAQSLEQQLSDLGMPSARFDISIVKDETHITSRGWDCVEFMLSANAGEPLKPLSKVASGGEMSRIMLALKSVGGSADNIPGMVFDEIDAGISGRIAEAVGVKLCGIARNRQVICVTHLPQIACLADRHFVVTKTERPKGDGGHTSVSLATLDRAGSIQEVARLAAGSSITETSLKHAEEMIASGEKLKRS